MKQIALRILWQSGQILFIVAAIALLVNQFRTNRLSLEADWSAQTQLADEPGQDMVISLQKAREAFFSKKAIFLDARPAELYDRGHIRGARNLPAEAVDEYFDKAMADILKDAMVITYCDGENCSLSKDLAKALFFRGYENVHVLVDGWSRWLKADLPVAKGGSGHPAG